MPLTDSKQRRLYRDLTSLLSRLRPCPFAVLDRAIEDRFRRFLKRGARSPCDTLSITFTWHLPEGADSWALYATEFHLEQRGCPGTAAQRDGGAGPPTPGAPGHTTDRVPGAATNVILFPFRHRKTPRRVG